jgi:hypothetical protein
MNEPEESLSRGLWQFIATEPNFKPITNIEAAMNYIRRKYDSPGPFCAHCGILPSYLYRHICWPAIYDWLQDVNDRDELYVLSLKLHELQWRGEP